MSPGWSLYCVNDAERDKKQESSEIGPQQQHDADTTTALLTGWPWRRVSAATPPRRRQVFRAEKSGVSGVDVSAYCGKAKENRAIAGTVCGINVSGLRFSQSVAG